MARARRRGQTLAMHIPAKVDYGIRALLALAAAGTPQTAEYLAGEQGLPPRFLGAILADLRRAGVVASQRGAEGGYRLARDPDAITIADVIRALDGPLAEVRGYRPEATSYDGAAENLQQVWVAVRASLRSVLEKITLTDVISGKLPAQCRSSSRTRMPGSPTDGEGAASVAIPASDYLWFVDLALGQMTAIVEELGDELVNRRPPVP